MSPQGGVNAITYWAIMRTPQEIPLIIASSPVPTFPADNTMETAQQGTAC